MQLTFPRILSFPIILYRTQVNNHHMDWYFYKIRDLVENAFARLKQFRGIATRYDKLKRNYESSVALACIFILLPL